MQRLLTIVFLSFLLSGSVGELCAQAPSAIPYQAVARNNSGNLIANQTISLRFSIRDASATGTVVYQETHSVSTNALGLFVVNIGQGTPVSGTFSAINWGSGNKFAQVEMDAAGGTTYTDMGTQQMLSVPYALYAHSGGTPPTAGTGIGVTGTTITNTAPTQWNNNGNNISFTSGNVGIGTSSPSSLLDIEAATNRLLKLRGSSALGTWLTLDNSGFEWNLVTTGSGNGEGFGHLLFRDPLGVRMTILPFSGNVGIGIDNPTQKLEVNGTTKTAGFQMTNGAANGYVLQSNASGNASWVAPTTYTGGTGIYIMGGTVTNTAPDQTVTLTGEGATSVSGSYPNFTISSTDNNTTYTGGTGIDIMGSTVTNTAPDQTVTLTGGGIANVTGTYPHFTVTATETDPQVSAATSNQVPKWNGTTLTDGIITDNGTNVGVGTTSPSEKLEVSGKTKTTNLQMTSGAANGYVLQSDASGNANWMNPVSLAVSETDPQVGPMTLNGVPRWDGTTLTDGIITDNGVNVGIGTSSPGYRFTLKGTGNDIYSVWSEDGTQTANNFSWQIAQGDGTSTGRIGYFFGNFGSSLGFMIGNAANAPLRFGAGTGAPERMRIAANGNVGIGTTSPAEKLDVSGKTKTTNLQLTSGAANGYVLQSDASGNASWVAPSSTVTETDPQVSAATSNQVPKWNGTTLTDGTITDNGNVGIGTSTPANKLDIEGGMAVGSSYSGTSVAPSNGAIIQGNVGIGTPNPSSLLHLYSSTSNAVATIEGSGGNNAFLNLTAGVSGKEAVISAYTGSSIRWNFGKSYEAESGSNAGSDFFINRFSDAGEFVEQSLLIKRSTGYVGLGTSTPVNKLDVEGGLAVGSSYSGTSAAPSNGAIIQGNVGIGTNSPFYPFQVSGTTNEMAGLQSSSTNGTWLLLNNTSTGGQRWQIFSSGLDNDEGAGNLVFGSSGNAAKVVIQHSTGNVGIGTNSPTQARLVVNGFQNTNIGGYGFLNDSGNTSTSSGTHSYSIYASARIAASEFNAFSDARIKNILGLSNSRTDLETLMGIEITDYKLKDHIAKGSTEYKKVIAQQIEEVYPQAVGKITDVVPDIYQLAEIHGGHIALANTLKVGEKVRLIFGERTELAEVIAADAQGFRVSQPDSGKVFVYGREVSDFRTVDYEALSTLNISATQELVKLVKRLEDKNAELQQRMSQLKTENGAMKSDIEQIKAALQLNAQVGKLANGQGANGE